MSDVRLTKNGVLVDGRCGVNEVSPSRDLEVTGTEIHSGGWLAGLSFADRATKTFVDVPGKGERWVWYSDQGTARLWSGKDVLWVSPDGSMRTGDLAADHVTASDLTPYRLHGRVRPFDKAAGASLWVLADRVCLSRSRWNASTQQLEPYPGEGEARKNVALAHTSGDRLVVNLDDGYSGGVEIQGAVNCPATLTVAGHDVAAELSTLKKQLADLTALVTALQKKVK